MEEKKTLKELYQLEYCVSEGELYPLQEWYNELIDKTVAELTLFDALRMLRQKVLPELAMLKTIQFLLQDVFAGDAYDGQALENLLQVDKVVLMPFAGVLQRIVTEAFVQCWEREWSYEGEEEECLEVLNKLWRLLNVYYIGGSPCSGKSTVAEALAQKYDMAYVKIDDFLDTHITKGAEKGYEICLKQTQMTPEQVWMREPQVQCQEELQFYHEVFEFVQEEIEKTSKDKLVIVEGAALLPELMQELGIVKERYICVTPTRDFQIGHYKEREWVPYVLEGCSDKEQAFANWMERDVLFAEAVRKQCEVAEYVSLITDGSRSVEEVVELVSRQFDLENGGIFDEEKTS